MKFTCSYLTSALRSGTPNPGSTCVWGSIGRRLLLDAIGYLRDLAGGTG
jgi:hypothetical protein